MSRKSATCDRNRLRLLLDNQLTLTESRTAELHLDQCPSCRRDLEWLAADPHWWRDASQFLRLNEQELTQTDVVGSKHVSPGPGGSQLTEQTVPPTFDVVLDYLEPAEDPSLLGRIGHYDVVEIVGQGGMGIVLKGFDRELQRYVAVKVLAPHFAGSAAARQRFAREAQAAAGIVHPHVIAIHTVDVSGPLPYLVMPYVDGQSLHDRLQLDGPLPLRDILRIGLQAAEGLAAAHAQGLVHRDVKPANILLEKGVNRVLLTDFGLARAVDDATLTRSGVIAGTPQFMSPEQARGDAVDCRSDLFSLGSVLYSMCTGYPPFRAETWMGVLRRITDCEARPVREINPDIPEWFERLIQQLHSKQATARPQTSAEVARTLEQCLAYVQQPVSNPLPRSLLSAKPTIPKPWPWQRITLVAATILLVALAGWGWWNTNTDRADGSNRATRQTVTPPAESTRIIGDTAGPAERPANDSVLNTQSMQDTQWVDSTPQELLGIHLWLNELERQIGD